MWQPQRPVGDGARREEIRCGANFPGHESANSLPHGTLAPVPRHPRPKRTPQTCSWSLRSRPSSWGRRVRPGPGAAACKTGGPGQAPEFRYRDEAEDQRDGAVGGEERPLDSSRASSSSCRCSGDDCSSLALLSSQPQLQPKTKTLPTCQQRRSSLGRAARASEQRGEGEEEERAAAQGHPSPIPGQSPRPSAQELRERGGGGGGASPLSPPRQTSPPREGEAGKCLCVCVYLSMGGAVGRVRVRACSPTGEREESRTTAHSTRAPTSPLRDRQHAPTHQALELSVLSSQPLKSCRFPVARVGTHVLPSHPAPFPYHSLSPWTQSVAGGPCSEPFSSFLVVSRLGQCCCCFRRRRCCRRCCRLPRLRGLHYRVLQWGLGGRCGAWISLCMDSGAQLRCRLLWGRAARPHLVPCGQGMQCRSWTTISLAGGWARFGGGGGGWDRKALASPAPPPPDRRWHPMGSSAYPPSNQRSGWWEPDPDATLAGETSVSERVGGAGRCGAARRGAARSGVGGAWDGQLAQWLTFSLFP